MSDCIMPDSHSPFQVTITDGERDRLSELGALIELFQPGLEIKPRPTIKDSVLPDGLEISHIDFGETPRTIKDSVLPGNIDTNNFTDAFDGPKTAAAAVHLVKLFQKQNPKAWEPIPNGRVSFYLHGLAKGFVTIQDGMLSVTDRFVVEIADYAKIDMCDETTRKWSRTPTRIPPARDVSKLHTHSKNPISRLRRKFWEFADAL